MKNYGIHEGYTARTEALTVSEDSTVYWNPQRIATAGFYQYPVYQIAAQYLRASDPRSFIDVGCGYPTKVSQLIVPVTGDVTLVDHPSMQEVVERDFPGSKFLPIDLEQPRLSLDERFDCVVSADVIEHLLDPDPLLEFLRSLLKPGGRLFLSTPERDYMRGPGCTSSPKPEHVREWNSDELRRYVTHHGLEIVEHHLLSAGRLNSVESSLSPILRRVFTRRYRTCQLAVCALPSGS